MGTINYGSNEYFNIGVNPENYWVDGEFLDFEMEFDYNRIKNALEKYNFQYFTVTIEPGYYEGFYIKIDFDYLWVDAYEKLEILKELTQLKIFLLGCSYNGLVEYYPGWCMGYSNPIQTKKAIIQRIKELKSIMRKYPTYNTYKKGSKPCL